MRRRAGMCVAVTGTMEAFGCGVGISGGEKGGIVGLAVCCCWCCVGGGRGGAAGGGGAAVATEACAGGAAYFGGFCFWKKDRMDGCVPV